MSKTAYERKAGLPETPGGKPRTPIRDREDRAEIEAELLSGKSVRSIARKYNCHEGSLYKWRAKMPKELRAAALAQMLRPGCDLEQIRREEAEGVLSRLAQQRVILLWQQDKARTEDDHSAVASLANTLHRNIELTAKLVGELEKHSMRTVQHLVMTPQYLQLRGALQKILDKFPDAKAEVVAAFRKAELDAMPLTIDITPALPAPEVK